MFNFNHVTISVENLENTLKFYEKFGFAVEGVREKYYLNNGEDALIMWRHAE